MQIQPNLQRRLSGILASPPEIVCAVQLTVERLFPLDQSNFCPKQNLGVIAEFWGGF